MKNLINLKIRNKGIGSTLATKILAVNGLSKTSNNIDNLRLQHMKELIVYQSQNSKNYFEQQFVNRKEHIQNKTYKGIRYKKNLPARSQRTHTNAQTVRRLRID